MLFAQNCHYNPGLANGTWRHFCFFSWAVLETLYCDLTLILMRSSQELKEQHPLRAHACAPEMLMWLFYCSKRGFGKWLQPPGAGGCCEGLVRGNYDGTDCGQQASRHRAGPAPPEDGCFWEGYKTMQAEKRLVFQSFQLNLEENISLWPKTNLIVWSKHSH